jgi:hypothetical protein
MHNTAMRAGGATQPAPPGLHRAGNHHVHAVRCLTLAEPLLLGPAFVCTTDAEDICATVRPSRALLR